MNTHCLHFARYAQYNTWFNGRVLDYAAKIPAADRQRDLGAFFGSIEATLDHILLVDRLWLGRIAASELSFPSLDGANLVHESEFDYHNSVGQPQRAPLWHTAGHLFNHQTHRRGQLTTLLMQLGQDVGPTDFILTRLFPEPFV